MSYGCISVTGPVPVDLLSVEFLPQLCLQSSLSRWRDLPAACRLEWRFRRYGDSSSIMDHIVSSVRLCIKEITMLHYL